MATSLSGTLTAGQVTTVTVSGRAGIEIVNRSPTGTIWYRLDGTDPVVAGNESHPVLGSRRVANPWAVGHTDVEVRLISADALEYTVEADPAWGLS